MSDLYSRAKARGYWLVAELSEVAGVTDGRVRQVLSKGSLRGDKVGQVWIVAYDEGLRWLEARGGEPSQDVKG